MPNSFGARWRKWDLHIHTPLSGLNQQFGTNFDDYVRQLFKKALEKNIEAIGITDYFSIEGYKKLVNEYLANEEKLLQLFQRDMETVRRIRQILIFPNIEFRLRLFVGPSCDRVNFHVLFSNEVPTSAIEENFLHELDFSTACGLIAHIVGGTNIPRRSSSHSEWPESLEN